MIDLSTRTPPVETTAHANAIDLCYQTFGDPASPALLLIMGLGVQMLGWDEVFCERLADHGYFVIRYDNRDIGKSTWFDHEGVPNTLLMFAKAALGFLPKVPYTLRDMAADAVGLLDALGIGRAHVVGASMGGMIGQELAIHWPQRMVSFTSIMSTTGDRSLPAAKPEASSLLIARPAENRDEAIAFHQRLMKVLRAGEFPEDEALDASRAAASWERGYHPAGSARQLAAIIASGNRTKALADVTVPTLVIHGRDDPLVPIEAGIATAQAIPNAELLVLERMGHALPLSTWSTVIDAIVAFAKRTEAQAAARPGSSSAP